MSLRQRSWVLVALLAFFGTLVSAQNTTNNTAASTFYLAKTETQFSVNIADESDDVFIYFTSPAYSWVGVGFGAKMDDSLMIIMYQSADGSNVTISPRIGSKASEPSFNSSINLAILPGTTTTNDSMLILRARCSNCRSYFDATSTVQPMIYAFGKAQNLRSDEPSAHLQRHIRYGHFTMDMTAATGAGGVPAPSSALNGVGAMTDMVRDYDRANLAHTVMGCLAIFLLWPLNVFIVAFFKNIKIHLVLSVLIMVFLLVSFVLGGLTSSQYNRSKAFSTPHQIFAFLTLVPLLGASLLPSLNRLISPNLGFLHTPLTSTCFLLLVLTGGLGLQLSAQPTAIILVYTAIALAVAVFLFIVQSCIRKRGSAHARALKRQKPDVSQDSDRAVMLNMMEERSGGHASSASLSKPALFYGAPVSYTMVSHGPSHSAEFGAHGQTLPGQRSPKSSHHYGGGTMPGPQYLLNMHPGVPVQVSRM